MLSSELLFFLVVVLVGGVLLVIINRPKSPKAQAIETTIAKGPVDLVQELLSGDKLTGAHRREWLDRLLVAQQSIEEPIRQSEAHPNGRQK